MCSVCVCANVNWNIAKWFQEKDYSIWIFICQFINNYKEVDKLDSTSSTMFW